jgi:polysaccharide biosynthesis protein PelC
MRLITLLALSLLLAACASQRDFRLDGLTLAQRAPLAVVPFDNLSANPNAGLICAELMRAELLARGGCAQVPPETVMARLKPLAGETRSVQQLGELLGAKTLLVGTVTEFAYKRGLGEEPVVGLSMRLVDAASGQVLWSGARSAVGGHWLSEDALSRLAQDVCRQLATTLAD